MQYAIFHTKTLIYLFLVVVFVIILLFFLIQRVLENLEDEHRVMTVAIICDGFQCTHCLKLIEPIHEILKGGGEKNKTYVSSSLTS